MVAMSIVRAHGFGVASWPLARPRAGAGPAESVQSKPGGGSRSCVRVRGRGRARHPGACRDRDRDHRASDRQPVGSACCRGRRACSARAHDRRHQRRRLISTGRVPTARKSARRRENSDSATEWAPSREPAPYAASGAPCARLVEMTQRGLWRELRGSRHLGRRIGLALTQRGGQSR